MAWGWIALAVLTIATLVITYLLLPKPEDEGMQRPSIREFDFPSNDSARIIGEVFGSVLVYGNYIYGGNVRNEPIKYDPGKNQDEQIVGWSWHATFAIALAHRIDRYVYYYFDDKILVDLNITTSGTKKSVITGKQSDTYGSGKRNGWLTFYLGDQTSPDPVLQSRTGEDIIYKNVAYVVFDDVFVGDNVRSTPKYGFVVEKTSHVSSTYLNPTYAKIFNGVSYDINPAHAIFYILYDMLKIPINMIDTNSFDSASQTLYNEGLGISFIMEGSKSAKEWIKEILRHIDGLLFFDVETGKYTLRLIRDGDLVVNTFTDDDVRDVQFSRQSVEDLYSQIIVEYTDLEGKTFGRSAIKAWIPSVRKILGFERSNSFTFMMITNKSNANKILKRLVKKTAYPLATLKMKIPITTSLKLGDLIQFSSNRLGINNMVFRVMNIGYDEEYKNYIEIECVEDIFSIADIDVVVEDTGLALPPSTDTGIINNVKIIDSYQEINKNPSFIALYTDPTGYAYGVKVYVNGDLKKILPVNIYALGTLVNNIPSYDRPVDRQTQIVVQNVQDIKSVALTEQSWQKLANSMLIDNEIIVFKDCQDNNDGTFTVSNLIRGIHDTQITSHTANTDVWFLYINLSDLYTTQITPTNTALTIDLIPFNDFTDGTPTTVSYTYQYRPQKPYPPSNIKANVSGNDTTFTIVPCVRQKGAVYKNADSIVAGEDEGVMEGVIQASPDNWQTIFTLDSSYIQPDTGRLVWTALGYGANKTWRFRTLANGMYSDEVIVNV